MGKLMLNRNGIHYDKLSFRLPSAAGIEGLVIENSNLSVNAEHIDVQWSWRRLFNHEIKSEWFAINDADIRIKTADETSETNSWLHALEIERLSLKNVRLAYFLPRDSTKVLITEARVVGLKYDGELQIDSLLNRASELTGWYSESNGNDLSDTTKVFSVSAVPGFRLGFAGFANCLFRIHYRDKNYEVSQFNLELSGINNRNALDMSLRRLAFRFQDSLNVNIDLNKAALDAKNKATFHDINVELPGLQLSSPKIELSTVAPFGIYAKLDSSWIDTRWIALFFPALDPRIAKSGRISIDGELGYRDAQLNVNDATVTLYAVGSFSATGFMRFGSPDDSLKLDVTNLQTTLYDVSPLMDFKIPEGQKNVRLHMSGKLNGTYADLNSSGYLILDRTGVNYHTTVASRRDQTDLKFSIQSPLFIPSDLVNILNTDLRVVNVSINGSTTFRKRLPPQIHVRGTVDSAYLSGTWYRAPEIDAFYSRETASLTLTSVQDQYLAKVRIRGDVFSGDSLFCAGTANFSLPHVKGVALQNPSITASYHGTILPRIPAANVAIDSLILRHDKSKEHKGSGKLTFRQTEEHGAVASILIDKYLKLDVVVDSMFQEWTQSESLFSSFPNAHLTASVHADSSFLSAVTGTHSRLDLDMIEITSHRDHLEALINADTVVFSGFYAGSIAGNFVYQPGQFIGKLTSPQVITPAAVLANSKLEVTTERDSLFVVSFGTYLPEIKRPLQVNYRISSGRDGFRVSFGDSTFQLGLRTWQTDLSTSLYVNRTFDQFSGKLQLTHDDERASVEGKGTALECRLDKLDLHPIANIITTTPEVHGILDATLTVNVNEDDYRWRGRLTGLAVDTVRLGNLITHGSSTPTSFQAEGRLEGNGYHAIGKFDRSAEGSGGFTVDVHALNLTKFSPFLPVPASTLAVNGEVNAQVKGAVGKNASATGFVAFKNVEVISADYDIYVKSKNDTLVLDGTASSVRNFSLSDRRGNNLVLNGILDLGKPSFDVTMKTDKFRLLDKNDLKGTMNGEVDIACNIRFYGGAQGDYNITGKLATLSGASINYFYKSNVSLDDRQREIEFVDFSIPESDKVSPGSNRRRTTRPINWDVSIKVGSMDVKVLFSEVSQDQIRATASGSVDFRKGVSAEPSVYGEIRATTGNIAYHVPVVSDLRMDITGAGIRWVGNLQKPLVSFSGFQTFNISPNEISSLWTNKTDRWPISVVAKVNDRALNDLVLNFDLSSTNNQVSDWIKSLAPETREAYAVSLLVRGRINTGGAADVNVLTQAMVSKMNEISARNIKSADVSFYDKSSGSNGENGATNEIGYSISKGLLNKKIRIIIGGNVDLSGQHDPTLPDVKMEYLLREDPTITLTAGRANVYTGVVDGNVDESALAITYIKRFRNLFRGSKRGK